jgi:bifunctional non-homologous end joining protein LigD
MLPHVAGRALTLRRYPNGVDGTSFFEKRAPEHRPDWIGSALGPGDRKGGIHYVLIEEVAALAWVGNMAALEVHAPMARAVDIDAPTMVVFDLDPGAPATIVDCCRVALEIQDVLADLDLQIWPKTSGSKGMQLYLPLNTPHTHEHASSFALAVAQVLENQDPKRVTSVMKKQLRKGKIFVDWSQNSHHKTTIAAYSLRARPTPTVSTPISWDEVQSGADGEVLSFTAPEVLERVVDDGDLFAPTATLEQELPTPRS